MGRLKRVKLDAGLRQKLQDMYCTVYYFIVTVSSFVLTVYQYSTYQYIYVGTGEQDVTLWNKGVKI